MVPFKSLICGLTFNPSSLLWWLYYHPVLQVHDEASFLKELSDGKRVVDIFDYYEKDRHSLLVLEYLEVSHIFL